MRRTLRFLLRTLAVLIALAGIAGLLLVLVLPSPWFFEKVRTLIISQTERVTGGRVEVGKFHFDWSRMRAEISPFILHGTEPAGEEPLFRAERLEVGLKIISAFKRDIDVSSVIIDQPRVNILVDALGRTNFPSPKIRSESSQDPLTRLIDLAIGSIALRDGVVRYDDQKIPINLKGENLRASFDYDMTTPRYQGVVSMRQLHFDSGLTLPMAFDFDGRLSLERNLVRFESARLEMQKSVVEASGTVRDFKALHADFDVKMDGDLSELGKPLRAPEPHVGRIRFEGKTTYTAAERYRIQGKASGAGLAFRAGRLYVGGISANTLVELDPTGITLTGVSASALGGNISGKVRIDGFRRYHANVVTRALSVQAIARAYSVPRMAWSGAVAGPAELSGTFGQNDLKAGGRFAVAATQGGSPIQGSVEIAFDQRAQKLQLGNSSLATPATQINFAGTLGENLNVSVRSTNLNDVLPALAFASENAPKSLPVRLESGGVATFEGTVAGPLDKANIAGNLNVTDFVVRDQKVNSLTAEITANADAMSVRSLAAGQGDLQLQGKADIALTNWRLADDNSVAAGLTLSNARVGRLLAEAGQKLPIDGLLSATVEVAGTVAAPNGIARVVIQKPELYGEQYDRIRGQIKYTGGGVELIDGQAEIGSGRVYLTGAYTHGPGDWRNGNLKFDLSTRNLNLSQVRNVQQQRQDVQGSIDVKASGTVEVKNATLYPANVNGHVLIDNLAVQKKPVGDISLDASTSGLNLELQLKGDLRGSKITGNAQLQMQGDYQSRGSVEFTPITLSTLSDLAVSATGKEGLPVDGRLAGKINFAGPARTPEKMTGRLEASTLEIVPTGRNQTQQQIGNLTLRNSGPVVVEYDGKALQVRSAHLVGRDTDLQATGSINPRAKESQDVRVNGTLNLALLQDFREGLLSAGSAVVAASVRGNFSQPQINGRMELKNASFYLADLPNGIDQANGVIVFDRNRATIERLSAQTGGGEVNVAGFIGFGAELSYRLQGRLDRVRVRYPEGVSTTINSTLTLTGSIERSLLSGVVTVVRAGFNPRTDIGSLLAASAKPIATPSTPNEFLRGMSFDVQIETVPNLTFQTTLTTDLQAEADLRLRGTAAKPVLLGRVSVNQGELQFFGTKYTINRGEINFYNPVTVEPVLDMDLETRVRGVIVNINFTGPLKRLNVSYRSDPPLQSTEIIALLAVGRAPGTSSTLATSQTAPQGNFLSSSSNSLLGQAISAPVSSRLQRFFGVSRLKIDPQLTGINAVPQARVTIEQQISRNITLTYITNLSNTNQQIVRFEWDLNRNWSLVALREENGVFGVDFFFKKRFQ